MLECRAWFSIASHFMIRCRWRSLVAKRSVVVAIFSLVISPACGGNPSGPSATGAVAGTATVDGQTLQFTTAGNASGWGRRPPNPAWPRGVLDIRLGNCNRPPFLIMAIYDGNPSPGRYEVPSVQFGSQTEGATASLQSPTEAWNAGAFHRGSSGSITVSSVSSTRVSGSFSFTMVPGGPLPPVTGPRPPPPTKLIEGTFDLQNNDGVVCP